jgi:acetylglutamate kinase
MIRYGSSPTSQDTQQKVATLIDALPYLHKFRGARFVIKVGGELVDGPGLVSFARDIVLLHSVGIFVTVVHGGGPQISRLMKQIGIEPEFRNGLRVTDQQTLEVTKMVLLGTVQTAIVSAIGAAGGRAVGLSGIDASLFKVHQTDESLGYVGNIDHVQVGPVEHLIGSGYIPVISSLGTDGNGAVFNVNADTAAGELAAALNAEKVVFLTNVPGIYEDFERKETLISEVDAGTLRSMYDRKIFSGGMAPKVEAVLHACKGKATTVHVLDGRQPHVMLLELFTGQGVGTMVFP